MKNRILPFLLIAVTLSAMSQPVVRGPYLQSVAQESIKILWRTDAPLSSKVEISMSVGGPAIETIIEDTMITDHIILVDDLTPGTTYYYRIGQEDGFFTDAHERYQFTTSTQTDEQLSFWAIGDFGSKNQNQIMVRDAFMDLVAPDYPDFWLWLGDNAYDDGKDFEYQERVFTPPYGYDSLMTFMPFYPVPGNHDYLSVNGFSPPPQHRGPYFDIVEVPQNAEAGGTPSNTELYYSFDYGNAHFVGINSEAFAYTFFAGSVMEEWLREDLRNTDKLWKIVYWHQPPYSKGSHDSDDFYEIFMKAMRNNYNPVVEHFGVDLVLNGHSHVYERSHLLRGHYGGSGTFDESMFVDNENPYIKYLDGDIPDNGTMYIVEGNSGKGTSDPRFGHPVMAFEDGGSDVCGSLLVEIDGSRLVGKYISSDGTVKDEFEIIKAYQDSSVLTPVLEEVVTNFAVYPNPTYDRINLEFSLKEQTMLKVAIYDLSGKSVYAEIASQFGSGPHRKSYSLADLNLSSGQYIMKLEGEQDGESFIQEQIIKVD